MHHPSRFAALFSAVSRRLLMSPGMLMLTSLAVLASCDKGTEEPPPAATVKLTPDDVASLLGIKGTDGLRVGEVESGKDGVKVKSISLKGAGSGSSSGAETEVEATDVELRISSAGRLKYALQSLRVGKLDVLDWRTTQRAQAFDVQVEKPGDRFLSKLETAIASARAGGTLRTADLSCERLSIDRLSYVVRSASATVTTVNIDKLVIASAGAQTVGELSVASVASGDLVAARGLKLTQIDRKWADQVLGAVLTSSSAAGPATQPGPVSATAPATAPVRPPVLDARLLPFDYFEVVAIELDLGKLIGAPNAGKGTVTNLRLTVRRDPQGRFTGLTGSADLTVAAELFGDEGREFLRQVGAERFAQSVAGRLELTVATMPDGKAEQSTVTLAAPGLATVSLAGTTRRLPEAVAAVLTAQEVPADYITASAFSLEVRDDGLLAYLLSDRFEHADTVRDLVGELAMGLTAPADDERVRAGVAAFMAAPKSVTWTIRTDRFLTPNEFFRQLDGPPGGASRGTSAQLKFVSAGPVTASLTTPDAATVRSDLAAYRRRLAEAPFASPTGAWVKFPIWLRGAEAGDMAAAALVGACYEFGRGVRKDPGMALRWYRRSAEGGNLAGMVFLGQVYSDRSRTFSIPTDHAEAMTWFRRAADAGDAEGMSKVGSLYDPSSYASDKDRNGITADAAKARTWYTSAADAGSISAMLAMARFHLYPSSGARSDPAEAIRWYTRAADAGSADASYRVGNMYEYGESGLKKDPVEAAKWYRRAHAAGHSYAKHRLPPDTK